MLPYVIDSFQHRDNEFNDATFPSLTTGYCQRIKSQLCLKWYNKYTVQGRFLSCWSGKLVFTFGKSAPKNRSQPASSTITVTPESDTCSSLLGRVCLQGKSSMSDVSSTLDSIDDKTPRTTNNDIKNYYYNKNNFTDRRIFGVPLHRSENEKKKNQALRAEQWFGFHQDGGPEDQA